MVGGGPRDGIRALIRRDTREGVHSPSALHPPSKKAAVPRGLWPEPNRAGSLIADFQTLRQGENGGAELRHTHKHRLPEHRPRISIYAHVAGSCQQSGQGQVTCPRSHTQLAPGRTRTRNSRCRDGPNVPTTSIPLCGLGVGLAGPPPCGTRQNPTSVHTQPRLLPIFLQPRAPVPCPPPPTPGVTHTGSLAVSGEVIAVSEGGGRTPLRAGAEHHGEGLTPSGPTPRETRCRGPARVGPNLSGPRPAMDCGRAWHSLHPLPRKRWAETVPVTTAGDQRVTT